ncbi:LysR family transcriptional regulator [Herbaspirillum sp. LeCh32-8]|uniref:LysR family transcriptional regulator n=1 Tax=Herbaspirillum sp. LeCh32-8 TaxID=2821356 RepID=UPI001AE78D64|nr:LysR family transcriptional regulator [Herbaspirillum sp. LeCh32-8]MBP0600811.1 LysR family transcriptional regulator [Herbaspirillum sp. LeCh32-8]
MKDERLLEMQVFKAVAEHGGFTAAAHALDASQPFVSRTMNSLEKRLGVALLRRSTRQVSLTEEGKIFLASCSKIIGDIEQAEGQVSSTGASASGDLRITAATSFGMDQVVPLLPQFMEQYPNVRVRLALSDTLVDLIGSGVDVAIRMGHLQDSMLLSRKLCHLQRIIVAAPLYIDRHGMPQTPDDLLRHNCLQWEAPMDHLNNWPFIVDGQRMSLDIRGNFRFTSGMSSVEMVLAGVGITRMAEHFALPAIRAGKLVPLLSDYQAQDETAIHAVYVKERNVHPRVRAFVNFLADKFADPPWGRA